MRTSFILPSGNYNIILSKNELAELLDKGHIVAHIGRIPCKTGRAYYDPEKKTMDMADKKVVYNDVRVHIEDGHVGDIDCPDGYPVQFVRICLDKDVLQEGLG